MSKCPYCDQPIVTQDHFREGHSEDATFAEPCNKCVHRIGDPDKAPCALCIHRYN